MQGKHAALEAQLREKEQLVAALTDRLEQAAEQLDRIHRTGGDRGLRLGATGVPPEFVEEQKQLAENLQRAVQQWEDMQCAAALGRIEVQVTELRDLISGRLPAGGLSVADALPASAENGSRRASPDKQDTSGGAMGWDALKASLLSDEGHAAPDASPQSAGAVPQTVETVPPLNVDEVVPDALPEPVDFDAADAGQLRQAIEARDACIADLVRKLRQIATQRLPQIDWAALAEAPEELRQRLESIENQFNAKLRMAEIELSLERARLGREEARLRMLEDQIKKEMRRQGLSREREAAKPDQAPVAAADKDASGQSKNSRWRRMLGMTEDGGPER